MTLPPSSPRSFLDILPDDVWVMVFRLLQSEDLCVLCRVSKTSYAVALPLLYRHIKWTWACLSGRTPPIVPFLESILNNPNLAVYVQTVELLGTWFYPRLPALAVEALNHELATDVIDKAKVPFAERWKKNLFSGSMDACVALLMLQASNIKRLVLEQNFTENNEILSMLLAFALKDNSQDSKKFRTFVKLEEVTLRASRDKQSMTGKQLHDRVMFFYLPQLKHLDISLDNPIALTWPHTALPRANTITSLTLSDVREAHLHQILSVVPKLKVLCWSAVYARDFHHCSNTAVIDLTQLTTALSSVRETLSELTLAFDVLIEADTEEDFPRLYLRGEHNLASMSALQKLTVPILLLTSFESDAQSCFDAVVPRSVSQLTLTDDLWDQAEQFNLSRFITDLESWSGSCIAQSSQPRKTFMTTTYAKKAWTPDLRDRLLGLSSHDHMIELL